MAYIVDGHNLIPKLQGLSLAQDDDEIQLISLLQHFCAVKQTQLEVFFDKAAAGHAGRRRYGNVTAIFVPASRTADEAIISRVRKAGKGARNLTVVSSDHRVGVEVRHAGASLTSSEQFARLLADALESLAKGNGPAADKTMSADELADWLQMFDSRQ